MQGGHLFWDGAKWVVRSERAADDLVHVEEISARIANGHGSEKHLAKEDLPAGVTSRAEYAGVISDTIVNGEVRALQGDRFAFWKGGSVVIFNSKADDFGSAYVPKNGYSYFDGSSPGGLH